MRTTAYDRSSSAAAFAYTACRSSSSVCSLAISFCSGVPSVNPPAGLFTRIDRIPSSGSARLPAAGLTWPPGCAAADFGATRKQPAHVFHTAEGCDTNQMNTNTNARRENKDQALRRTNHHTRPAGERSSNSCFGGEVAAPPPPPSGRLYESYSSKYAGSKRNTRASCRTFREPCRMNSSRHTPALYFPVTIARSSYQSPSRIRNHGSRRRSERVSIAV